MKGSWSTNAWDDYAYWQGQDRKIVKKINELIKDIQRNGNEGLGKPEPLRHELLGFWSRRISLGHRLVYNLEDDENHIAQCRHHYEK